MTSITNLRPVASFISKASAVKSFFRRNNEGRCQKAEPEDSMLSFIGDIKASYSSQPHSEIAASGQSIGAKTNSHDRTGINSAAREMVTISPIVIENQSDTVVLELAPEAAPVIFDYEDILEIG